MELPNNVKKTKIIKILLAILLSICISAFNRVEFSDVFTFYESDGSVQGLEVIYYIMIIIPINMIILVIYIQNFFNSNKKRTNIVITLIINAIILPCQYINISLILYDIIYIIYYKKFSENYEEYHMKRNWITILTIISIFILIFFPANPTDYEKYALADAKSTINNDIISIYNYEIENNYYYKDRVNNYISIYKKYKGYISYKDNGDGEIMPKKVEAYINNNKVTSAKIEYKTIIYEFKNGLHTYKYRTTFNKIYSSFIKIMCKNLFKNNIHMIWF